MKTMKLVAMMILVATAAATAPVTCITNYFAGYVAVTQGWTTAENSGLSNGTAYVAIPVASLPAATAAALVADGTASDVRVLMYAICDQAVTGYDVLGTNAPANAEFTKGTQVKSATQLEIKHTIRTQVTIGSTTIKAE